MAEPRTADKQIISLKCTFCGSKQFKTDRCTSCGAMSLDEANDSGDEDSHSHQLVQLAQKILKAQNYLIQIALVLAMALLAFIYYKQSSAPIESEVTTSRQHSVEILPPAIKKQPVVLSGSQSIHSKIIRAKQNDYTVIKNELSDYPQVETTWGDKLNPNKTVPEHGFKAFYFDSRYPSKVLHKETVKEARISYSWSDFHDIDSRNFGAYWVGTINLSQPEKYAFHVNQGRSKSRVIINGSVVHEATNKGVKNRFILLDKGKHFVEIEFMNNWHTTDFSVSLERNKPIFTSEETKNILSKTVSGQYEFHYASLYKSAEPDKTTILNIEKSTKQVVLVLSSYQPINWYISNPFNTKIGAIIYGSYDGGSKLSGETSSIGQIQLKGKIGLYDREQNCRCQSGYFHCEHNDNLTTTIKKVESFGTGSLTGYTIAQSASYLKVPQNPVDNPLLLELQAYTAKLDRLKKECKKRNSPNFDKLFDGE